MKTKVTLGLHFIMGPTRVLKLCMLPWFLMVGILADDPSTSAFNAQMENRTSIQTEPELIMYQGDVESLDINITCLSDTCSGNKIMVHLDFEDPTIAKTTKDSSLTLITPTLIMSDNLWFSTLSVNISGVYMGKTRMHINTTFPTMPGHDLNYFSAQRDVQIRVILRETTADTIFDVVINVMLAVTSVGFGCSLELDKVKGHFRRPYGIIIAFICQFGVMPSLAIAWAMAVSMPKLYAYGLLCLGCSPGGGVSNIWSLLLGGDINLSIAMTLMSTLAALGMTPLWLYMAGGLFVSNDTVIPYEKVLLSLAVLTIPCTLGILIKHFLPKIAKYIVRFLKVIIIFVAIIMIVTGALTNSYMTSLMGRMDWRTIVPSILLPWSAYLISGAVAFLFHRPWQQVKTISIETAIQNAGVAIVVLTATFDPPDEEYARFPIFMAGLVTPIPLLIIALPIIVRKICEKIRECRRRRGADGEKEGKEEKDEYDVNNTNDIDQNGTVIKSDDKTDYPRPSVGKTIISDGKLVTRL